MAIAIAILDTPVLVMDHELNPFTPSLVAPFLKCLILGVVNSTGPLGALFSSRPAIRMRNNVNVSFVTHCFLLSI